MLDLLFSNPLAFFILFPGLLLSITIHEFAHAWTADKLGDPTPRYQGRVTLDPRAHLDPLGTLAMLLTRFGWGRPVEFDPYNLKNPIRDTALIAIAGPISNMIVASVLALILRANLIPIDWLAVGVFQILIMNVVLAIFNLVPVYPLDGSKVLLSLLPKETAYEYDAVMRRYGMIILILMIFPWAGGASPVSQLISPVISFVVSLLV
jgi:Zn-dependent protease